MNIIDYKATIAACSGLLTIDIQYIEAYLY
jgi:hypothetical protein